MLNFGGLWDLKLDVSFKGIFTSDGFVSRGKLPEVWESIYQTYKTGGKEEAFNLDINELEQTFAEVGWSRWNGGFLPTLSKRLVEGVYVCHVQQD